ncbi:MAG TPA: homoserine kinase [Cytophagales bacterium]|jgi:homoserine kinase|nr:homoserine kinase [Cytophagales bacterium]
MPNSIRVFAPATVANVSCGFDVLGFAVNEPGDEVLLKKNDRGKIRIVEIEGDNGQLPRDIEANTCSVVIQHYLKKMELDFGVDIWLKKNMPLGSGLGSSAASAVAAIYAINILADYPKPVDALLPFAMEGEKAACGTGHADNVAPALFGGFVLIRSYNPLDIVRLKSPDNLFTAIVHPHLEVKTKDAREILKKEIRFSDSVTQSGNLGGLVAGLLLKDYDLIGRSLQDHIVEPIRAILIPGYDNVKAAAMDNGALGAGISGSGPSIFALAEGPDRAKKAGDAMKKQFEKIGVDCDLFISPINQEGPRVLD